LQPTLAATWQVGWSLLSSLLSEVKSRNREEVNEYL
jgi:hypothetical protein